MNFQKKAIFYTGLPVIALSFLVTSQASAHGAGRGMVESKNPSQVAMARSQMFEQQASALGISLNDYKNLWAQGMNFKQIAEHLGIPPDQIAQKLQALKQEKIKVKLSSLVSQGVITQEQADKRMKALQENKHLIKTSGADSMASKR